jgi:hypothetical protein
MAAMGEMKKIVTEHYPVEKLPEELRAGIEGGQVVRVTVETEVAVSQLSARSLRSFLGIAPGRYGDPDEIVEEVRRLRDEWER